MWFQKFFKNKYGNKVQNYSFKFSCYTYNVAYNKLSSLVNSLSLIKYGEPIYYIFSIQLISLLS